MVQLLQKNTAKMKPVKLFIQIPCYNEEEILPKVIASLPKEIKGIDEIYTLVVDDGSIDHTIEVAKAIGVDYILRNPRNIGLAKSFNRGIETCLGLGADIIVNTDGDNQYVGSDIAKLIEPILNKKADIVVGCRNIDNHAEFSTIKKFLQKLGSHIINRLSNIRIPDATSGFRAISRDAAIKNTVMSSFSYTLEMLIQAGRAGQEVGWVPIRVNPKTRPSRLLQSNTHFIYNQLKSALLVYLFYCPMVFFSWLAGVSFFFVLAGAVRIAYYLWFVADDVRKFKSGTGFFVLFFSILSLVFVIAGLLGSVLSGLRYLIEDLRCRIRIIFSNGSKTVFNSELIENSRLGSWKNYSLADDNSSK